MWCISLIKAEIDGYKQSAQAKTLSVEMQKLENEYTKAAIGLTGTQAEAVRQLYDAKRQALPALVAERDSLKASSEMWKGFVDGIDHSFRSGFMRTIESGQSMWKSFTTTLANTFKTGVADYIYRLFAKPIILTLITSAAGSLGMSGLANAATAANTGSNLLSGASTASNLIETGGGLLGSAGAYSAITGGSMAAGSQAALLAAQTGEFGAAGLAATAGASAGMTALATAIPYVGIAIAAASALGLFDSNNEPPPGSRRDNWATLQKNNGVYSVGSSEVPDPAAMTALAQSINAALNDPSKYDQATLDKLVGTSVSGAPGTGSQALIDALTQKLSPAADAAAKTISDLATATTLAAQQHQMEIQLMQAQGDAAGALAAQRKDELAALDPTLRALQQQIYAAEDLANAANGATGAVQTLAQQLDDLKTQTTTAVDAQIQASQAASQTARTAADSFRQITTSLSDAVRQLRGGDLSPLLPAQKLAEARAQLDKVYGQASTGDATALAALPQTATDFLNASRAYNASSQAYTNDFNMVTQLLSQAQVASQAMTNWSEYQATLLETQTGVLQQIKDELAKPSPDAAVLSQQASLLSTIAGLLQQQTTQIIAGNGILTDQNGNIVAGNVLVHDQTGQIIGSNFLLNNQTGQIVLGNSLLGSQVGQLAAGNSLVGAQTGQIITGNAIQDAIKNLTDANKGISASMLDARVNSANTQANALTASLTGTATTNALLQRLIGNMDAQTYADWQAKFQADASSIWKAIEADASIANKLTVFDQQWAAWQAANPMPSHASGLAYVPYDGYMMQAHKGEGVLDAGFMSGLRRYGIPVNSGGGGGGGGVGKDDIESLKKTLAEAIAKIPEILQRMAEIQSRDVKEQTALLSTAVGDSAQTIGRTVARAAEASTRA